MQVAGSNSITTLTMIM